MRRIALALMVLAGLGDTTAATASWTVALPFTPKAQQIRSMDIHSRPNRPLHVYGNMVRRGR